MVRLNGYLLTKHKLIASKTGKKLWATAHRQPTVTILLLGFNLALGRCCSFSVFLADERTGGLVVCPCCQCLFIGLTSTSMGNNESLRSHFGHFPPF